MRRIFYLAAILLVYACNILCRTGTVRDANWAREITGTSLHNFYRVNDSIYRCEQPGAAAMAEFAARGIKTILNLRADRSDSSLLGTHALHYYQVKFVTKHFTDADIIQALQVMKQAPKPLLVHCKHGADRTGVVIAMYRIVFENWTKEKALDELIHGGYGFHTRYRNIPAYINNVDIDVIKRSLGKE